MMFVWLLACPRTEERDPPPPAPNLVRTALEERDFIVVDGEASRLESDCCVEETCLLANPDNDYIGWWLPRGQGQTEPNPRERSDGMSHIWRLRADEAVVAVGRTPPPAAYFSYRSYLDDRYYPSLDARDRVMVNLGDSLNQFAIHTDGGPFSAPFALVATADANTYTAVREALVEAGIPEEPINLDVVNAPVERMPDGVPPRLGLHAEADTFRMNNRLALFDDAAIGEAYLDAPDIAIWRVTPRNEQPFTPITVPELRARGSGQTEEAWADAFAALEAAILDAHPDYTAFPLITYATETDEGCPPGCNRDTFFAVTQHYVLPDTVDAFVEVYGVNHERTGKSVYSNFSIIETEHLSSYAAVHSRDMPGSARQYLPDHPQVDDLYAWRFSRSCALDDPYCISVPYECPGFAPLVQGSVAFRAYPEATTATGPLTSELLVDRAVLFVKWP